MSAPAPQDDSVRILRVDESRAEDVHRVVIAAFEERPPLDPPATATAETPESLGAVLAEHGGLLVEYAGGCVGALVFDPRGRLLGLRRVGVLPSVQGVGVAARLAEAAAAYAAEQGYEGLELEARAELPATVRFWQKLGYDETRRDGTRLTMRKLLPEHRVLPTADDTRALGLELAAELRAGDLVILAGDLGAGKTTFTQGLGEGLGVRGTITSPTFVIARVHPSLGEGPPLVHVDAYRLGGPDELDDLDLDTDLDDAVTVVEWGGDMAELLSLDRLELTLERAPDESDEARHLTLVRRGARWIGDIDPVLTGA